MGNGPLLTIVIPVYGEPDELAMTVRSALTALRHAEAFCPAEFVIVDDGSHVPIEAPVEQSADHSLRVMRLERNSGRFAARRHGVAVAKGDSVLLLDAGVTLGEGALAFVASQVAEGRCIWNGHVEIAAGNNPLGLFWVTMTAIAFDDYHRAPRTTSFSRDDFDRYPKGTGCFFAPRELLAAAFSEFTTRYSETRFANDDAPLLRRIAERAPIGISPEFMCIYYPRTNLAPFLRHARHRGVVFFDGHARPESRFFEVAVSFFPASVAFAILAIKRPRLAVAVVASAWVASGGVAAAYKRPPREIACFGAVAPLYAVVHGLGMWRGLLMAIANWLRGR